MSTTIPNSRPLLAKVGLWLRRANTWDELRNLSDRTLQDIGLTRCDRESTKPFWMP